MNGIKKSVEIFDSEPSQIMSMLMMTQYTDMIKESIHAAGQVTISLNAAPTAAILLEDQIKQCIKNSESSPISAEELVHTKQRLAVQARERERLVLLEESEEREEKSTTKKKKNRGKSGNDLIVSLDKEEI
jgi:hypothetical protein